MGAKSGQNGSYGLNLKKKLYFLVNSKSAGKTELETTYTLSQPHNLTEAHDLLSLIDFSLVRNYFESRPENSFLSYYDD